MKGAARATRLAIAPDDDAAAMTSQQCLRLAARAYEEACALLPM